MSPRFLAYVVGPIALGMLVVLRQFGLVANAPVWVYVGVIGASLVSSRLVERWPDAPRGSARLHIRVLVHVAGVTLVIYTSGWGPALGMAFAFSALADLQQSGAAAWRAALGWSIVGCTVGQALVFEGFAPSMLSVAQAQTIGFLGAFIFSIAIRMAGAIGEDKQRTEDLLARREAMHRAVVENAAEGIFTIDSDGLVLSFNAAAEVMFGWSADELVGQPGALTLAPEFRDGLSEYLEIARAAGYEEAPHGTWQVGGVRRDGSQFPMEVSTSAIVVEGFAPVTACIARDLSAQKQFEERLAHQAVHDALTGLPNRVMLMDRLEQALARTRRQRRMTGLLYADLDRFKVVNDTLGHAAGDLLLVEAATRIRSALRETDTLARLGGDEFVVIVEGIDGVQQVTEIAERVLSILQAPFRLGEDDVHVSASIGIAISAGGSEAAEAVVANADIAMYRAKKNGRRRYELFDEAMQQWVTDQAALENALRRAVAYDELRLHYQPIVDAESGEICAFEALVRWERPGFGLVGPDDFIPTAEETGLIVEIGEWVLDHACREATRWSERWPDRRLGVSVNMSSRQLGTSDIIEAVTTTLARTKLNPTRLTLELTESTLIDDTINTQTILQGLRDLGVNLSLDDFGTGYSSLTYLSAFPINVVKIDKSFVRTIGTERQDTAIVTAVLALAKNLNIAVIAEGVETQEQLAVLLHLRCPYLQGYLFSEPRPIAELAELIEARPLALVTSPDAK